MTALKHAISAKVSAIMDDLAPYERGMSFARLNRVLSEHVALIFQTAMVDRALATQEAVGLLDWLAAHTSLELSYEGWEDDVWYVHQVNGRRIDREWTLVAQGKTPLDALRSARTFITSYKPEDTSK